MNASKVLWVVCAVAVLALACPTGVAATPRTVPVFFPPSVPPGTWYVPWTGVTASPWVTYDPSMEVRRPYYDATLPNPLNGWAPWGVCRQSVTSVQSGAYPRSLYGARSGNNTAPVVTNPCYDPTLPNPLTGWTPWKGWGR